MRAIIKREFKDFTEWKRKGKHKQYRDLKVDPEINTAVRASLSEEQHGLCCYCCNKLQDSFHIEHFKPQEFYPQLSLDYGNMHASCTSVKPDNKHCGAKKGNHDPCGKERSILSPLNPECSDFFEYDLFGYILPMDDNKLADDTISVLGLNAPALRADRRGIIEAYLGAPDYDWKGSGNSLPAFYNVIEFLSKQETAD